MNRRKFIETAGGSIAATYLTASIAPTAHAQIVAAAAKPAANPRLKAALKLETFDYANVRLLPGMFAEQTAATRQRYFALSNDDVLKGFRERAGMSAPGKGLSGWCAKTSAVVFGQWLSGMARLARATDDAELRAKAVFLSDEWAKTVTSDKNYTFDTYTYEKMVCGLTDLGVYAAHENAWTQLEKITAWATKKFDRSRSPATPRDRDGRKPRGTNEWYTLPENLYRAYAATGNELYRDFGDVWRYDQYWNLFKDSTNPKGAEFLHSYSHANTFNSAAMVFAVTGDQQYLQILRNAHEYLTKTQIYASGGYGPGEWSVPDDGSLGRALEFRSDTAEVPCDTWGAFKLCKYLLQFTGEARYGDWIERLLYNGIGASPLVQPDGKTFYYADYRLGLAQKQYFWDHYPCCSGTYLQAVADYHDLIYFQNSEGLFINLYVPSEAAFAVNNQAIKIRQETAFPEAETIAFTVDAKTPTAFALRFRVPAWASDFKIAVNNQPVQNQNKPGEWASVARTWQANDKITITMPLRLRVEAIDSQHPRRAAVMFGPVLLAQHARFTMPLQLDETEDINSRLVRQTKGFHFKDRKPSGFEQETGGFSPYYAFAQNEPYRVYFDLDGFRFL